MNRNSGKWPGSGFKQGRNTGKGKGVCQSLADLEKEETSVPDKRYKNV